MPQLWVDNAAPDAAAGPFATALLIAGLIHLILILGVDLAFPKVSPGPRAMRPLEVMLLQRTGPANEEPEIAASSALSDGMAGAPEADDRTSVELVPEVLGLDPLPALGEAFSAPVPPLLPEPTGLGAEMARRLVAPVFSANPEPAPPRPPFPESEPPRVKAADILASRNLALAELTARIQHNSAASASRSRRKAIGAGTRDYRYANYLEAWYRKVERVGNLNYPEEAKRRKLYGNLTLQVALRADGSLEWVRVLRSSGFDLLDEAAVRIVELAAPFSPFPPAIRAETDILDITRTWRFLSSNRLGWRR